MTQVGVAVKNPKKSNVSLLLYFENEDFDINWNIEWQDSTNIALHRI